MIETKRRSTILDLVIAAIILLIAVLFWPNEAKFRQSNPVDRSKTQIKILNKRINIREEPDINSKDLGDVYRDEIYTVLGHVDNDDYYWYKIKTNNDIEGYIGSDVNDSWVVIISGYIDRKAPEIIVEQEPLIVLNDKNEFDSVTCKDDYTECSLSYEEVDSDTIIFTAIDDAGNISRKDIKYYNVYNLNSEFYDNSTNITAKFNKSFSDNYYIINANYRINKTIEASHKSKNYTPMATFYDAEFKPVNDVVVIYNNETFSESCINDSNGTLKEAFLDIDLLKGNSLCMSYKFNKEDRVKYVSFGFQGIENYDDNLNVLANYFSKYFLLDN